MYRIVMREVAEVAMCWIKIFLFRQLKLRIHGETIHHLKASYVYFTIWYDMERPNVAVIEERHLIVSNIGIKKGFDRVIQICSYLKQHNFENRYYSLKEL